MKLLAPIEQTLIGTSVQNCLTTLKRDKVMRKIGRLIVSSLLGAPLSRRCSLDRRSWLLALVAITVSCRPVFADGTFVSTVKSIYRLDPVVPLVRFDAAPASSILPGAAVVNLRTQEVSGTMVLNFESATVCAVPDIDYGEAKGTTAFSRTFEADASNNELRLLFGLEGANAATIQSYGMTVRNARYYLKPFDEVVDIFRASAARPGCDRPTGVLRKMVVRPIFADIDVRLTSRSPLSAEAVAIVSKFLGIDHSAIRRDAADYFFSLKHRIIAVRLE